MKIRKKDIDWSLYAIVMAIIIVALVFVGWCFGLSFYERGGGLGLYAIFSIATLFASNAKLIDLLEGN